MTNSVIRISDLGKRYRISHRHRPDSLKAWLRSLAASSGTTAADEEFWALREISLELHPGECLALIGCNGSGKSTLLKIISRIIPPTTGYVRIKGRVASLLEIGTGFHPELTGRENVFLNAAMLGCPSRVIRSRLDSIIDFSGVERFLDTPVKHYSSGMYVRLAYAVAAHVDADILVIDEVLTVGDAEFQQRCYNHLQTQFAQGKSGIVVSHDPDVLRRIGTHAVWLDAGHLRENGSINDVLDSYIAATDGKRTSA